MRCAFKVYYCLLRLCIFREHWNALAEHFRDYFYTGNVFRWRTFLFKKNVFKLYGVVFILLKKNQVRYIHIPMQNTWNRKFFLKCNMQ